MALSSRRSITKLQKFIWTTLLEHSSGKLGYDRSFLLSSSETNAPLVDFIWWSEDSTKIFFKSLLSICEYVDAKSAEHSSHFSIHLGMSSSVFLTWTSLECTGVLFNVIFTLLVLGRKLPNFRCRPERSSHNPTDSHLTHAKWRITWRPPKIHNNHSRRSATTFSLLFLMLRSNACSNIRSNNIPCALCIENNGFLGRPVQEFIQ